MYAFLEKRFLSLSWLLILLSSLSWAADDPRDELREAACALPLVTLSDQARRLTWAETSTVNIQGLEAIRLMAVFTTNGCSYYRKTGGCTMCGFNSRSIDPAIYKVRVADLSAQLEAIMSHPDAKSAGQIDLLTAGSFLDPDEIPRQFWYQAATRLSELPNLKRIAVDARPEYITSENLSILRASLRRDIIIMVGIGIESSNDRIRNELLNKRMTWDSIRRAVKRLGDQKDKKLVFQAYLLIKPHPLSDEEAVADAVSSAIDVAEIARRAKIPFRIAFEPVFVGPGTRLEEDFIAGRYKPPSLWTIIEVVSKTMNQSEIAENPYFDGVFVGMSDEGLSTGRKPASCSLCQGILLKAIADFNGTQRPSVFGGLSCPCMIGR